MGWTVKQKYDLDNSMSAAQNVQLGTVVSGLVDNVTAVGTRGSYTAVAGDDTANKMVIASGLPAIAGWIVQIYRAGVLVGTDATITVASTTNLQIADSGTYATTAGDVVKYMIW